MRGFEKVSEKEYLKHGNIQDYNEIILPRRSTKDSAGYDFYLPSKIEIKVNETKVIPTGIKSFMKNDEVLLIVIRSSLGIKYKIRLLNQVGVIDSDYYNNEDNEGHILIAIENTSNEVRKFNKGDRIAQGIFLKYLVSSSEEEVFRKRIGGVGSTKN